MRKIINDSLSLLKSYPKVRFREESRIKPSWKSETSFIAICKTIYARRWYVPSIKMQYPGQCTAGKILEDLRVSEVSWCLIWHPSLLSLLVRKGEPSRARTYVAFFIYEPRFYSRIVSLRPRVSVVSFLFRESDRGCLYLRCLRGFRFRHPTRTLLEQRGSCLAKYWLSMTGIIFDKNYNFLRDTEFHGNSNQVARDKLPIQTLLQIRLQYLINPLWIGYIGLQIGYPIEYQLKINAQSRCVRLLLENSSDFQEIEYRLVFPLKPQIIRSERVFVESTRFSGTKWKKKTRRIVSSTNRVTCVQFCLII